MTTLAIDLALERVGDRRVLTGFGRPFGLAADGEGRLYVADMDLHAVARLAPDLATVQWHSGGSAGWSVPRLVMRGCSARAARRAPGTFNGPHSVTIAADGAACVVTYYKPGLHWLGADGAPRGLAMSINGEPLAGPATARLDRAGRLWVTEYAHHCVAVLDAAGEYIGSLGGETVMSFGRRMANAAGQAAGAFDRPHMASELADGTIVVADTWNHRLQRFDRAGRWLGWLGGGTDGWQEKVRSLAPDTAPGAFHAPVAVGPVADGRFVVTDWGNNRLQWFDADGRLQAVDDTCELDRPYDAQLLAGSLVIADSHHGRVLIAGNIP